MPDRPVSEPPSLPTPQPPARRLGAALRSAVLALALLPACVEPPTADPDFWRPWYDEHGGGPSTDGGGGAVTDLTMGAPGPGGVLTATVVTTSAGGKYSPRNIGAIWIADAGGHFLKTLTEWGSRRRQYLYKWQAATAAAGTPGNTVDAITSATLPSHGTRTGQWSCTDWNRRPVADGRYQICFELTDRDAAGPSDCVPFDKGRQGFTVTPADAPSFTARTLVYRP